MAVKKTKEPEHLSAPWWIHHEKLKAMFRDDADVTVGENLTKDKNGNFIIDIEVSSAIKAMALDYMLKKELTFGNVKLYVNVVDTMPADSRWLRICKEAFDMNPIVEAINTVTDPTGTTFTFPMMSASVIQYPSDNSGDYYGNTTSVPADVARDLFEADTYLRFSTVKKENA